MARTFAQNIDYEKNGKQIVLQVAKWFVGIRRKTFFGNWISKQCNFYLGMIKANLEINSSKTKCQGVGSNGPLGPLNDNPRSQKGPAAEGVALKIRNKKNDGCSRFEGFGEIERCLPIAKTIQNIIPSSLAILNPSRARNRRKIIRKA